MVSLCVCVSNDLAFLRVCDYTVKLLFYSAGPVSETTKSEQAMWPPTGRHIHKKKKMPFGDTYIHTFMSLLVHSGLL